MTEETVSSLPFGMTRRQFLKTAAAGFVGLAAAGLEAPVIQQMNRQTATFIAQSKEVCKQMNVQERLATVKVALRDRGFVTNPDPLAIFEEMASVIDEKPAEGIPFLPGPGLATAAYQKERAELFHNYLIRPEETIPPNDNIHLVMMDYMDKSFVTVDPNRQFADVFGKRREELLRKSLRMLFGPQGKRILDTIKIADNETIGPSHVDVPGKEMSLFGVSTKTPFFAGATLHESTHCQFLLKAYSNKEGNLNRLPVIHVLRPETLMRLLEFVPAMIDEVDTRSIMETYTIKSRVAATSAITDSKFNPERLLSTIGHGSENFALLEDFINKNYTDYQTNNWGNVFRRYRALPESLKHSTNIAPIFEKAYYGFLEECFAQTLPLAVFNLIPPDSPRVQAIHTILGDLNQGRPGETIIRELRKLFIEDLKQCMITWTEEDREYIRKKVQRVFINDSAPDNKGIPNVPFSEKISYWPLEYLIRGLQSTEVGDEIITLLLGTKEYENLRNDPRFRLPEKLELFALNTVHPENLRVSV